MIIKIGIIVMLALTFGLYGLDIEAADPVSPAQLRKIVLRQPDFKATLDYSRDEYSGVGIDNWIETVFKKGKIYRFDGFERERSATRRLIILGYPGKELNVIFPDERHYNSITQNDLDQASFTTLRGMDLYYVTKLVAYSSTRFEYVSTLDYKGCSCWKVRVTNPTLLNEITDLSKEDIGFESIYLTFGPLYLHVCASLKNLIMGVSVEEEGTEKEIYSLTNVSLDISKLPADHFRVPSSFRKSD